ncbi:hypothetical protein BG36_17835 [Aquamicrobium defluvii]|uniref:Tat pathway signal protein n=2 Tax=Aquamicrobium defluvii TaxID=69279 RepID=A0A011TDT1_9HYPH|nr:hypothetical protein BG36_17835 [Aquamicrobium defluvii]EZQ16705.1 hypothetical protein CF98_39635 [Halopseudomonas bauzanensis]TDR38141.1 hypothetical protein DES43_101209 [Aquamicrobium defluvii]
MLNGKKGDDEVKRPALFQIAMLAFAGLVASPSFAQDAAPEQTSALSLELNAAQPSDKGCRLTFVVNNGLGSDLTKASYEIALFDDSGVVDRMTVLDFKELPAGKTKVTRFDLSGMDCTKISRVLVNGSNDCAGEGIEPSACMKALKPSSKTDIRFGL